MRLFKRLLENSFTVNGPKCVIGQESAMFFGVIISNDGMKPYPENIKYLPRNKGEVMSLLGLCTFISRFIKISTLSELLRKNTPFKRSG